MMSRLLLWSFLWLYVLPSTLSISLGRIFKGRFVGSQSSDEDSEKEERFLLPQLPPHPDTHSILEFTLEKNPSCEYMKPIVERAERKFNTKIKRISISSRPDYLQLYEVVGGNEYGNVPFYYNRRTSQAIGGATSFKNLCKFIAGERHAFSDPPDFELEKMEYVPEAIRDIGMANYLRENFSKKLVKKLKADKKEAD